MSRVVLLSLLLGVLLVTAPLVRADDYDDDEDEEEGAGNDDPVADITASNFEDLVKSRKFALVSFTAPWCGHCKSLKPEWSKAAAALKEYDSNLVVGNVDATVEKDLASQYGVKGYPTIKFFVEGQETDYTGGRTSDDIVKWVKKKTGPPATTLTSGDKIDELLEGEDAFVLGYFDKLEGPAYDDFVTAARLIEDAEVFETTDKAIAAKVKLSKPGLAVARKSFGEWEFVPSAGHEALKAQEGSEAEKIGVFVKNEVAPVYAQYSQEVHGKVFGSDVQEYVFVFGSADQIKDAEEKVFKPVVPKYKGKTIVVSIDLASEAAGGIVNYFLGADKPTTLTVMAWNKGEGKKFKGPEKVDKATFDAFLNAVVSGTAEPFYKSEELPAEPTDADGLTTVVGKNFESIVLDENKDVLLEVYAPWCGHCKSLAPTYKKLAKRFKKVDSVVIAQVDGTANEHKDMSFQGFPTIKFYPAGSSEPMNYEGDRTLKDFTKFIKKNAKIPFELPKKGKKDEEEEEEVKDEL